MWNPLCSRYTERGSMLRRGSDTCALSRIFFFRENRSKSADGFSGASKAAKKARAKKATQQLGKAEVS
eukprot:884010-Amorphochlora_amoeboformis.AAC.1